MRSIAALALAIAVALPALTVHAQDAGKRYAKLLADTQSFERNNEVLTRQLDSQRQRIAEAAAESAAMDQTAAAMPALLDKMFQQLEAFIAADIPFRDPIGDSDDSRKDRMERLRGLMGDPGVTVAEKYRRLLEAYQIEIEYGRSMAAYTGVLEDGRKADYVRIGRVALMYRTEDGTEAGYWDRDQKQWVIDNDYRGTVLTALRVARKELAPDVIQIPIPAAQEVRS
ncbi:MAG: DUF3450 domain-containing protein [Gammaproteobacteria bacterium]